MTLPTDPTTAALLQSFPLSTQLRKLVVEAPITGALHSQITTLAGTNKTAYAAGLWLFADDLDKAHVICQSREGTPTFDFWHAILHRREGDFSNSKYWFKRAGSHGAMPLIPNYNPIHFIDSVEKAHQAGKSPADLIALQQTEWLTLITWCAANNL